MVAFSESGIRRIWGEEPPGGFRVHNAQSVAVGDTDAYGNTLIFTNPGPDNTWFTDDDVQSSFGANSIIYCGYRFDPEAENNYVRNRYHAPALSRWLTRDPIGYRGGINLYGYVAGSPVGNVDAWGEKKGDRWYGFNDPILHDWVHREGKIKGQQDFTKDELKDPYDDWKNAGKPDGEGHRTEKPRKDCGKPEGEGQESEEPGPSESHILPPKHVVEAAGAVAVVGVAWEIGKQVIAVLGAPETGGQSLWLELVP